MKQIKITKTIHCKEYQELISLIKRKRKELGISQRELAAKLNVSHSYIAKIELRERRVDIIEIIKIFIALECNPCTIITDIYLKLKKKNDFKLF
ncbi:MAG: helix-turn-helix domain-containing protein [Sedimentisphaeraceae bacterium JB056]